MPSLQLMPTGSSAEGHGDEVLTCAYAPDCRFVLSGGWDGHLRLWDAASGTAVHKFQVSKKPVSACTVSPDGKHILSGTLEGLLSWWDAATYHEASTYLAHTRPISAIIFGNDARILVTASWDTNLTYWPTRHEGRHFLGHSDIVAGGCITPDGLCLLSWSYDHTVRLWEVTKTRALAVFKGHSDRVLCGAVSPDGRWAATGSRDQVLKLWDLAAQRELKSTRLLGEVRCCFSLLDGQSLVAGDANGRLGIYSVPDLVEQGGLDTGLKIQCGALAPSGAQIALGCGDGCIRLVAIEGFDSAPLLVKVIQSSRRTATTFQRLFGKSREIVTFVGTCPACRSAFELPADNAAAQAPCPGCRRQLRVALVLPMAADLTMKAD